MPAINILPTAFVRICVGNRFVGTARALCDTGANPNLIAHNLVKGFYSSSKIVKGTVEGVGNDPIRIKREIMVTLKPWYESDESIEAKFLILPQSSKWCPMLPHSNVQCADIDVSRVEQLADPSFWQCGPVSLILGIEIWVQLMQESIIRLNKSIVCQNTRFGTVIMGQGRGTENGQALQVNAINHESYEPVLKFLERFWKFEDLHLCTAKDAEQEMCEAIFKEQHSRDADGRFVVAIPIKPNVLDIGSSRRIALKRFLMLERRFARDKEYHKLYVKFMREFADLGHIVEVPYNQITDGKMAYHMPHHGVMSSSVIRVVLDASCKTDKGISLNEVQMVGEKLQRELVEILLSFRLHPVGMCTDISKMYRQVKVVPEQWDLQRFFWRENPNEPLKEFCINRVIYGMASAAHCAIRAMLEGAKQFEGEYPEAVRAIKRDFYVDDGITGADSEEEAIKLAKDMIFVQSQSGFHLSQWTSNNPRVMQELKVIKNESMKHNSC